MSNRYALNQLLRGCNVGLVATLAFKQDDRMLLPTRDFCCATTHIFSRAEAHGIKLWQVCGVWRVVCGVWRVVCGV